MARRVEAGEAGTDGSPAGDDSRRTELQRRAASAVLLAAGAIALLTFGGIWFMAAVAVAGLLMLREWQDIMPRRNAEWRLVGLLYIALPCLSALWLRDLDFTASAHGGFAMMLYLFAVVTATDTLAYFGGRAIGGPKLAPRISPKKTWSGAVCGLLAGVAAGGLFTGFVPFPESRAGVAALSAALSALAQAGDLFESWVKRRANVKDSGRLLPGHGGLLDRLDGYMFTAPLLLVLSLFFGNLLP